MGDNEAPHDPGFPPHTRAEINILNEALKEFFEKCEEKCKSHSEVKVHDFMNIKFMSGESKETFSFSEEIGQAFDELNIDGILERVHEVEEQLTEIKEDLESIKKEYFIQKLEAKLESYKKVTICEETRGTEATAFGRNMIPSLDSIMEAVRTKRAELKGKLEEKWTAEWEAEWKEVKAEWKKKMEEIFEQHQEEMLANLQKKVRSKAVTFIGVDITEYKTLMERYASIYAECCPEAKTGGAGQHSQGDRQDQEEGEGNTSQDQRGRLLSDPFDLMEPR